MRSSIVFCFIIFLNLTIKGQIKLYTLDNDSIIINQKEKLVLVYYTNKSCFDCFFNVNDFVKTDTSLHYYFVIEKTTSSILNYEIYMKLINRGIDQKKILFTKHHSNEISPYLEIIRQKEITKIPYSEIFEDKKTLMLSEKTKKRIKN